MLKDIYVTKVKKFTDLEDNKRVYKTGDEYPAEGAPKPSDKRIAQLSSKANKARVQIIERLTVEVKDEEDASEEVVVEKEVTPTTKKKQKTN
ncbi:hypothetical protein ACO1PF_00515 [Alkalibacterium sp. f15]|uniref:hypothetical protein n=1 Tax=Alkalibacterium sp. f15 TaxID=3414029 RepID=UPI003BF819A3